MYTLKQRFFLMAIVSAMVVLSGCTTYIPAIQPPVTIKEKGQIQADASVSFTSALLVPLGLHGSIAYGITDNTSVQLSTNMMLFDFSEYDICAGNYFINKNKFRLGVFPGYSHGRIDYMEKRGSFMSMERYDWTGNYQNFYVRLQSLIDLKILTLGIGAKTGVYAPNIMVENPWSTTAITRKAIITQPTIYIKPNIKYDIISCGLTITYLSLNTFDNFQNYNSIQPYLYNPFIVAFGFTYKLNTRIK